MIVPFDALHLGIAFCPLGVYLLLMGWLNLARRPLLTTGSRDIAALGIAISGFMLVGPLNLFFVERTVHSLGGYAWLLVLALYFLMVTLWVLLMKPKLVIYNITNEQLRPILSSVAAGLDKESRWAGDSLTLPSLGVQLYIDPQDSTRHIQLISTNHHQSFAGWRKLEVALADSIKGVEVPRNPYSASMIGFGAIILAWVTFQVVTQRQDVAQSLRDMLQL